MAYVGDSGGLSVNVSDTRSIAINTLGSDTWPEEFSAVLSLEQGLKTNDVSSIQASIGQLKDSSDRYLSRSVAWPVVSA